MCYKPWPCAFYISLSLKGLVNSSESPRPPTGYRIQDNKLGLTASLLAGRAAKCLLPPRPPLKGWAVKVLSCPQAAGQPTKNRDLTSP